MNLNWDFFSSRWIHLTASGLFLILAFALARWQGPLEGSLTQLKEEYQIHLDLSRHKAERSELYQGVLQSRKLPEAKRISANVWIQLIQEAVSAKNLSLEELKPIDSGSKGRMRPGLSLVVEGRMPDLLNFLYHIAKSDDFSYVEQFLISVSSESAGLIRAQMRLSQLGGH